MATTWNLAAAERTRAAQRTAEEDRAAVAAAHRGPQWRAVRADVGFLERSRRRKPGAVRVAERYLRDDLHCGIARCPRCEAQARVRVHRPARCLPRDGADIELLVPDAQGLLQLLELLEDPAFARACRGLLVLETVLGDALRLAPSRDATRLRSFFRDDRRMRLLHEDDGCVVVVFADQHHVDTAVDAQVPVGHDDAEISGGGGVRGGAGGWGETEAARHDRGLVRTLRWYATQHLPQPPTATSTGARLVLVTPDVDSPVAQEVRTDLGLEVLTCEDFVRRRCPPQHRTFLLELAANTLEAVRWWRDRHLETTADGVVAAVGEFPPHLSPPQLTEGLRRGDLIAGRLDVSAHNPLEAFVLVDKGSKRSGRTTLDRVFVYGREAMNRGIHGDEVVVELLPETAWRAPQSERVLVHYAAENDNDNGPGGPKDRAIGDDDDENGHGDDNDNDQDDTRPRSPAIPTARVVGILARSSRVIVATVLGATVSAGDDHALAIPMDARVPKIRLRSQRMDALLDQRLRVVVDHWPMDSMYPSGHYTAILGPTGDLDTELAAILVDNEIEQAPFCEAALACLPEGCDIATYAIHECSTAKRPVPCPLLDWAVPDAEGGTRRDLRESHRVFSVDPPGCQDIDDAMSVRRLANGNIELGVHIADVTHFVPHASPLDIEGRTRGTTVYLVGQRLDMLPCVLSADLCSLHEHVDRLAMSVIWELDGRTLEVLGDRTWYGRTIIRSCASMTYDQAHRILQGLNADTGGGKGPKHGDRPHRKGVAGGPIPIGLQRELAGDLNMLTIISRKLAKARGEEGGLDLSRSETFSLNVLELGAGVEIVMKESLEIHSTIAELMILANSYVARKIVEVFPTNALVRRHPPPSGPRFERLIKIAEAKDITIDASNNFTLQQSLVNAERSGRADSKTMALLKSLAVRVMSEAEYVCVSAAEATTDQNRDATSFAHYGLGLQYYTHFTSPIRRYADIIVHRQLLAALELEAQGIDRVILSGGKVHDVYTRPHQGGVALPASLTPSVLHDDNHVDEDEDFLDGLISDVEGKLTVAASSLGVAPSMPQATAASSDRKLIFPPDELVPLTHHLNRKNRNAKQASRSCEELFLALYFSTHTVRTHAIITALKQNGFLVYIPTYDLRAPVYVRDREGFVQMDPLLCGVRIVDTRPPTGAFASADCIRLIPQARIQLDPEAERLDVVAPDGTCTFKILDEVEVQISCDLAGFDSRVPKLQLQLVGRVKKLGGPRREKLTMTTKATNANAKSIPELQQIVQTRSDAAATAAKMASPRRPSGHSSGSSPPKTLYDVLCTRPTIEPPKKLLTKPTSASKKPSKAHDDKTLVVRRRGPGRLVFGDYEPSTTQHYQQKLASYMDERSAELEEELRIDRHHGGSGIGSAEEMKRIEREAMSRTMRLAAEKRHDRINRRNKSGQ